MNVVSFWMWIQLKWGHGTRFDERRQSKLDSVQSMRPEQKPTLVPPHISKIAVLAFV